ncbi:MAG: hypothetical protein D6743_10635 [Calditrichaeota bacterium]|nr:MAG: hypothetical protein D6743_10635 [Calditrichota bacterium]
MASCALAFLLCSSSLLEAGAWTQKRGRYYLKFGFLRFRSSSQYFLNGDRGPLQNNGRVLDLSFYTYFEYGLLDDLTLVTSIPFKSINFSCAIQGCDNTSSGLADLYFGFRYRLSQTRWVVAVQSGVKIAPGYETDEDKLGSAPPLGDGQTDVEFRLLLGRSLFNYKGYVNVDTGYRARSGEPVDEIPFSLELGMELTKEYQLIGRLQGVRSISEKAGQSDFRIVNGMIRNFVGTGAVEDFLTGQLQLVYHIHPTIDLSFEVAQVLTGRNTSYATTVGIGVALHR